MYRMEAVLANLALDQLNARRSEALDALHKLQTGARAVDVRFGDRVVRFQDGDAVRLERYIQQLQAAIDMKTGAARRGPIHFGVCR